MRLPFLHKPVVKKITGDALGIDRHKAETMITALLRALPELVAAAVLDIQSGKVQAAYTALASFDPYKVNNRDAELARQLQKMLQMPWLAGQELTDLVVLLEDQLHCLRPLADGRRLCYVVVRLADTNMAVVRNVMRQATA